MSFDNHVVELLKGVHQKKAEMTERFGNTEDVLDRYLTNAQKLSALYIGGEISDEEFEKNRDSLYKAFAVYSLRYGDEGSELIREIFDIAYSSRKAAKTPEELTRIKTAFSVDQDQDEAVCAPFE
jgi:hypothetical protein